MKALQRKVSGLAKIRRFTSICFGIGLASAAQAQTGPTQDGWLIYNGLQSLQNAFNSSTNAINNGVGNIGQMIKELAAYDLKKTQLDASIRASLYFQASPASTWAAQFYAMIGETMFAHQSENTITGKLAAMSADMYSNAMTDNSIAAFPTIAYPARSKQATYNIIKDLPLNDGDVRNNISNYNIEMMLGQDVYPDENSQKKVQNFISTLTLVGTNFQQGANEANLKAIRDGNDPNGKEYLALMGAYAAGISVGLSTFYDIAAKRYPQDSIKSLGLKDMHGNDIQSSQQLERYLAERRALSPTWYNTMAAAAPATVQRELLYLMAEMRLQEYHNQQTQEKILATLAAIHVAGTRTASLNTMIQHQSATRTGGSSTGGTTGAQS